MRKNIYGFMNRVCNIHNNLVRSTVFGTMHGAQQYVAEMDFKIVYIYSFIICLHLYGLVLK